MVAAGWGSADWFLGTNDPGVGVSVDRLREYGLPLSDVTAYGSTATGATARR